MRIELLGPLVLDGREGTAVVPAAKQRAMLAALALRAGRVVSFEDLAETAWDDPPETARVAVRNYVLRLRRALGPDGPRILTRDPGYLLDAQADDVDALAFGRLCDEGGSLVRLGAWDKAAETLRAALALWRGTPLADIPSQVLYDRWSPGLEEARLRALRDRIRADLQLGLHESVTSELRGLTRAHPLDEQFWELLMLALYRSGRQGEALESYRRVRDVLVADLGVEPGPDLRRLHQHILTQDPALDAPARADRTSPVAVPRQLPNGVLGFVGRAEELKLLDGMIDASGQSSSAVVISAIGGTAGVGKTTLAVHFAHRVAERFADGQLYVDLRGFHPVGKPVSPHQVLGGFLVALGVPAAQVPTDVDARVGLYRSLLAGKRLLVLLDNAVDADQVRQLLPGSPGCLVLITSRNQLTSLSASGGAPLLILDLLTQREARDLLIARLGREAVDAEPAAAAEVIGLCSRLPLALAVVAARAAASPELRLADLAAHLRASQGRLDALDIGDPAVSVRSVFSWSYQSLSKPAQRMFRLLGLHPGPDISVAAAVSLVGTSPAKARRGLAELTHAHLLTEHIGGRYAFHDLLGTYAAEQAAILDDDRTRREAIGRILDHYLHTAYAADRVLFPARDAIPLAPASRPGIAPEHVSDAGRALAWFTAEHRVLIGIVSLAAGGGFDACAWQLPWAMATFLSRQGHSQEQVALQSDAVAAAERLDDIAGQAVSHRILGDAHGRCGDYRSARAQISAALVLYQRLGDRVGEATVHQSLSWIDEHQERPVADALSHAERALRLFRDAGHRPGEAKALNNVAWYHALLGDHQQACTFCRRALALFQELGNRYGEAHAWDSLAYAEQQLGNLGVAIDCYQQAVRLFREEGVRFSEAESRTHLGDAHRAAGSLDQARDAWRRALDILDDLGHPDAAALRVRLRGHE